MRRVAANLAALLGAQAASWLLMLGMLIIVPHYLGDAQYGRISFAVSFVGFFGLLAGCGCSSYVTKEVARDHARLGPYVFNALLLNVPLIVLFSAVAIAGVRLLGYPRETCMVVAVVCLGMGLNVMAGTMAAGLQGEQRMGQLAAWTTVGNYAANGAVVAALVARRSLPVVAFAQYSNTLITFLANGRLVWGRLRRARVDPRLCKTIALGGLPFLLWNVVLTIYGSVDVTMLSYMAGDAVVGWYTLAYKLVGIPVFLPSLVLTAFFPALSAQGARRSPEFARLANQAIRVVSLGCIPMAAGIALICPDVFALLHYPAAFGHAIPLVRILALHIPVVAVTTIMGGIIMADDRQTRWVVVGAIAAILNPLLNLIAIPLTARLYGNAAIGASVVTVLTELVMFSGAAALRPDAVLDRATAGYLLRCLSGGAVMVGAVLAAGAAPLPARIALAVAAYGLASLALRTISPREAYRLGLRFLAPARLSGAANAP